MTNRFALADVVTLPDGTGYVAEFDDPDVELVVIHKYEHAVWIDSETGEEIGDVVIGRG